MEDLLGRVSTVDLYQPFLERLNAVVNECEAMGYRFYAICGLRSFEEQARLYAIGRTTGTPGHYVTKAKPGQSLHQFGIATDFALDADRLKPGLQPKYEDHAYHDVLAEVAERHGLEAGALWHFTDEPHLQLPLTKHDITLAMLGAAYANGGQPSVFKLLDAHGPW